MMTTLGPPKRPLLHAGHDDHGGGDPHPPERTDTPLPIAEEPLDPASQSLADALHLSFRLLKVSMVVLVLAYMSSGAGCVQPDEQVVVLRFGKIIGDPLGPGFHFSLPYPIDERISVPVKQQRSQQIDLFWLRIEDKDRGKELDELSARASSLDPVADGALITGDKNLIHLLARVLYSIGDPVPYVRNVLDEERMIRAAAESSMIAVLAAHDVDPILRGQSTDVISNRVRRRVQRLLDSLDSGITVDIFSIESKTPPLQVRHAFTDVQRAESEQLEKIEVAKAKRTEALNEAAGAAHDVVLAKIQQYAAARDAGEEDAAESLRAELISLLANRASGEAARLIQEASTYRENVVQEVEAEVQRFAQLLPYYRRNPEFLVEQLWIESLKTILGNMRVEKYFLPRDADEIRVLMNKNLEGKRELERQEIAKDAAK